ncbi:MAG: FAD-binding protein, partial [Candidatus Moranbacteria bacterium]|nr:FAD-binding protein [Candidatus Moranbacteria bacterium]
MKNSTVYSRLKDIFADGQILTDEPMKNHTSFKIGGKADFIVLPQNDMHISRLVRAFPDIPITVMGNGSNLLVSDKGIRGIVVKICNNMSNISTTKENILTCQSGALLSKIAYTALSISLGGFEFAAGIPGTLGGAVAMNAGAYDGEMKDVIVSTRYVDEFGEIKDLTEHNFGYRTSVFSNKKAIITQSTIRLYKKSKDEIKSRMAELSHRRREKQPLEYCSAGSTFKRPEGFYAGKLIQDAG